MNHCATCGAPLPAASQFCPRCGADLRQPAAIVPPAPSVPPPARVPVATHEPSYKNPTHVPPPAAKGSHWWIVPLVIIGVVVIAFLLLMGLPFGRDEAKPRASAVATETIAEGEAPPAPGEPAETATLVDLGEPDPVTTTTVSKPPVATTAQPQVATTTIAQPPPVAPTTTVATTTVARTQTPAPVQRPAQRPAARVVPPPPMTSAAPPAEPPRKEIPARSGEISESEAVATLRGFLVTRNYYDTGAGCLRVSSAGYRNVGYTLDVHDSCASRQLGRWRVDSKTREVFRQREDGRFLRP